MFHLFRFYTMIQVQSMDYLCFYSYGEKIFDFSMSFTHSTQTLVSSFAIRNLLGAQTL